MSSLLSRLRRSSHSRPATSSTTTTDAEQGQVNTIPTIQETETETRGTPITPINRRIRPDLSSLLESYASEEEPKGLSPRSRRHSASSKASSAGPRVIRQPVPTPTSSAFTAEKGDKGVEEGLKEQAEPAPEDSGSGQKRKAATKFLAAAGHKRQWSTFGRQKAVEAGETPRHSRSASEDPNASRRSSGSQKTRGKGVKKSSSVRSSRESDPNSNETTLSRRSLSGMPPSAYPSRPGTGSASKRSNKRRRSNTNTSSSRASSMSTSHRLRLSMMGTESQKQHGRERRTDMDSPNTFGYPTPDPGQSGFQFTPTLPTTFAPPMPALDHPELLAELSRSKSSLLSEPRQTPSRKSSRSTLSLSKPPSTDSFGVSTKSKISARAVVPSTEFTFSRPLRPYRSLPKVQQIFTRHDQGDVPQASTSFSLSTSSGEDDRVMRRRSKSQGHEDAKRPAGPSANDINLEFAQAVPMGGLTSGPRDNEAGDAIRGGTSERTRASLSRVGGNGPSWVSRGSVHGPPRDSATPDIGPDGSPNNAPLFPVHRPPYTLPVHSLSSSSPPPPSSPGSSLVSPTSAQPLFGTGSSIVDSFRSAPVTAAIVSSPSEEGPVVANTPDGPDRNLSLLSGAAAAAARDGPVQVEEENRNRERQGMDESGTTRSESAGNAPPSPQLQNGSAPPTPTRPRRTVKGRSSVGRSRDLFMPATSISQTLGYFEPGPSRANANAGATFDLSSTPPTPTAPLPSRRAASDPFGFRERRTSSAPSSPSSPSSSVSRGKRKAEDIDTGIGMVSSEVKQTQPRATFAALPSDRRAASRQSSDLSRAPSAFATHTRKRARLSAPNDPKGAGGAVSSASSSSQGQGQGESNMGSWSKASRASRVSSAIRASLQNDSPSRSASRAASTRDQSVSVDRRRSLSQASIPMSAFVSPHAPSLQRDSTQLRMREPKGKPWKPKPTGWGLRFAGRGEDGGEEGSPVQAWAFFVGFVLFPVWWVVSVWGVPRTRHVGGSDTEKGVVVDDPQVEYDARSWRTRCRVMAVVSLFTYIPFIVLVAVFVSRNR